MLNLEKTVKFSVEEVNGLPETRAVFWIAAGGEILFARLAENLRLAAEKFIEAQSEILSTFPAKTLEISYASPPDLLDFYGDFLRQNRPRFDFVLPDDPGLPFLILTTSERFPRVLATRRPENAAARGDAVYGAFAPRTGVRFLLDFVQRVFKLHPCELDIQGDFDAPCPEYFLGHCLAPCVASICDDKAYAEAVEAAHLLLADRGAELLEKIDAKIANLADALEFEKAAERRDARRVVDEVLRSDKWKLNVSGMNDVLTIDEEDEEKIAVYATTLKRGKRTAQNRFEARKNSASFNENEILIAFIAQYYRHFAPKQIFVPGDFPERKFLERLLGEKFGRRVKIVADSAAKLPPTVQTARKFSASSFNYRRTAPNSGAVSFEELKSLFNLPAPPRRIECFDVAHLAGENIVAGRVVAENGVLIAEDETVWEFKNLSEIESLAAAVGERLRLVKDAGSAPDLIVLDGGRAHLKRVEKILQKFNLAPLPLIAVVKPAGQHSGVSYFLSNNSNEKIPFDRSPLAVFLQKMRDAAHDLANRTHQRTRTLAGIFKDRADGAPQVQYLLVPVRFAERFGAAEDIIPIRSVGQSGKLLLKSKGGKSEI